MVKMRTAAPIVQMGEQKQIVLVIARRWRTESLADWRFVAEVLQAGMIHTVRGNLAWNVSSFQYDLANELPLSAFENIHPVLEGSDHAFLWFSLHFDSDSKIEIYTQETNHLLLSKRVAASLIPFQQICAHCPSGHGWRCPVLMAPSPDSTLGRNNSYQRYNNFPAGKKAIEMPHF